MIWKITTATLIIALIVILFFGNQYRKESSLYKTQLENEYRQKLLKLEQQLQSTERQRLVLGARADSLNSVNKDISRLKDKYQTELVQIKGRYKTHTPSELETEMIRRARQ